MNAQTKSLKVKSIGAVVKSATDKVVIEEPLEIVINRKQFAITMRTPGNDVQLVTGLMFSEGLVKSIKDIKRIDYCESNGNKIEVELLTKTKFIKRKLITNSSCGLCGRELVDRIMKTQGSKHIALLRQNHPTLDLLMSLPKKMKANQKLFAITGGSHAAALFDLKGTLISCFEDIGRHNAVDKLIGDSVINDRTKLSENIMLVSGRTSFEIVQKAYLASIPIVMSVSAASSLAVEFAKETGISVYGMIRQGKINKYC